MDMLYLLCIFLWYSTNLMFNAVLPPVTKPQLKNCTVHWPKISRTYFLNEKLGLHYTGCVHAFAQGHWGYKLSFWSRLEREQGVGALPDLWTPWEPKAVIFQIAEGILIKLFNTKPQSHTCIDTHIHTERGRETQNKQKICKVTKLFFFF